MRRIWAVACFLPLLFTGLQARAEEEFLNRLPNAENTDLNQGRPCSICHLRPQGDGDRNDFGFDYENAPGTFAWPSIYMLDSDGDGQSNGLEMGDPEGVWRPGDRPARTVDLSNPGDPRSLSFQPKPDLGPIDFGVGDGSTPDAGVVRAGRSFSSGCRCVAAGSGFGAAAIGAALVALVSGRRRRDL